MKIIITILIVLIGLASPVYSANTKSIDFEASSTQMATITDANQTGLGVTSDFSVQFWAKWESLYSASTYNGLFGKFDGANQRSYQFFMYETGSVSKARFILFTNSGEESFLIDFDPDLATWYQVSITVDFTAQEYKLYIDGSQQGSTQSVSGTSLNTSTALFMMGMYTADLVGSSKYYFDGRMDDFRFWGKALSEAEIIANMDCQLVGDETDLNAYWKFEDDLLDETSNDNDLTNVNSATYNADVPTLADSCGGGLAGGTATLISDF